jgi:hypothetical protein
MGFQQEVQRLHRPCCDGGRNIWNMSPKQNQLLAVLPAADYGRVLPELELEPLPVGSVLFGPDSDPNAAHFPISGIVSWRCGLKNGASAEKPR